MERTRLPVQPKSAIVVKTVGEIRILFDLE
jgi:hypothetical protein